MKIKQFIAMAIGVTALAGCTSAPAALDFELFNRDQVTADRMPEYGVSGPKPTVDPASSRLLVDRNGIRYFAARMSEDPEKSVCLFAYAKDDQSAGACGGYSKEGTNGPSVGNFGIEAKLLLDGADTASLEGEGWTVAHPNLVVRAQPGVQPK